MLYIDYQNCFTIQAATARSLAFRRDIADVATGPLERKHAVNFARS